MQKILAQPHQAQPSQQMYMSPPKQKMTTTLHEDHENILDKAKITKEGSSKGKEALQARKESQNSNPDPKNDRANSLEKQKSRANAENTLIFHSVINKEISGEQRRDDKCFRTCVFLKMTFV